MPTATLIFVLAVVFVASLIRSTFGFGEALISVPLLALVLPVSVVAPLAVLLSITIAAVVIVQDWRHIHLRSAIWLLLPTFLGIPLGLLLLTRVDDHIVKGILGAVIALFAAYLFWRRSPPRLHTDNAGWLLGCGLTAGILGGAYGMNGPPLVIYGAMRGWSPQHFRATLQGYFLPASLASMVGYWVSGLWVPEVTHDYLISLVTVLPAILLGRWLNRRMHGDAFLKYVYVGLQLTGLLLLLQASRVIAL